MKILAFHVETQKPRSRLSFQNREQGFENVRSYRGRRHWAYLAGAAVVSFGVERYPVIWFFPTSNTTIS